MSENKTKIHNYRCPMCKATATSVFMRGPTCPNCGVDMEIVNVPVTPVKCIKCHKDIRPGDNGYKFTMKNLDTGKKCRCKVCKSCADEIVKSSNIIFESD